MWLKSINNGISIKNHFLFILFSVFYLVFSLVTYKDYGITSDEQLEYRAGRVYFNYIFSNSIERQKIVSQVSPKDNPEDFPYFRLYPGIVSLINYQSYYEWAHLINLIFGFFGFLVIYLLVYDITRSKWAVLAPLLLFLNPYYLGHIPANPKDIPFATLYLFFVYLIIKTDARRIKSVVLLGVFTGILVGVRFVGISLLCVLATKLAFSIKNRRDFLSRCLSLSTVLIVALVTIYALWPYLWSNPVTKFMTVAKGAQDISSWDRQILFDGQLITKDTRSWYYLFTYLFYKTPILVLVGLIGSLFISVKSRKVLVILTVVALNLVLYLVFQPTIYNEMRHFLYLVPLITSASAIFYIRLLQNSNPFISKIVLSAILVGTIKMSYDFILLHPYQYTYFNEFAGKMTDIIKKYEVDYWSTSYKESSEFLRDLESKSPATIKVYPCNLAFGVDYYSHKNFGLVNKSKEADYIICDYQNALISKFDLEDKIVFRVTRKGATLSYVAKTAK